MKKYNITIEQPLILSIEIEAKNIENALKKASKIYNKMPKIKLSENWNYGTDAQIMAESEDETESTEWDDLYI